MEATEPEKSHLAKAEEIAIELVDRLGRDSSSARSDAEPLYVEALTELIDALLDRWDRSAAAASSNAAQDLAQSFVDQGMASSPERIGMIYEHLRGFKLVLRPGKEPDLVPSAGGKRNQGLFYTPRQVVRHIVANTIDAVDTGRRPDSDPIRVLDPSVGTGLFPVEALDRLTALSHETEGQSLARIPTGYMDDFRKRAASLGVEPVHDDETARRVFILDNCIYGVDTDPLAVRIAAAALKRHAFGRFPVLPDVRLNLRVGNSLMGAGKADASAVSREREDFRYATFYTGKKNLSEAEVKEFVRSRKPFHWAVEFPEVFDRGRDGFDAVMGNPPYEILSAKESGIEERRGDQAYFRKTYRTCRGKINTYRLMIERGLDLLRCGGALGFIVPATLLADSTAHKLREMLLDETAVLRAVTIPEKARIFEGVTQALLIFVTRKGGRTEALSPILWDGKWPIPETSDVSIHRRLIGKLGSRIPLLKDAAEKGLLERLAVHPSMSGNGACPPAATVHQGEINLTVHREFITDRVTDFPLVRGEHVHPFRVEHPSSRIGRLDWVEPIFPESCEAATDASSGSRSSSRGRPWLTERIVLGRVVNMGTERRLKAAWIPEGYFLGDMTNYLTDLTVSPLYMLGLLNSSLLNWRFKVTSANNYVSAAEIENLPIPRIPTDLLKCELCIATARQIAAMAKEPAGSISECLERTAPVFRTQPAPMMDAVAAKGIELVVSEILNRPAESREPVHTDRMRWLDALVLVLYGA